MFMLIKDRNGDACIITSSSSVVIAIDAAVNDGVQEDAPVVHELNAESVEDAVELAEELVRDLPGIESYRIEEKRGRLGGWVVVPVITP